MTMRTTNCVAWGVDDVETAARFYAQALGFTEAGRGEGWIELETGSLRVFLTRDDGTTPTFDLAVADVAAAAEQLIAQGFTRLGQAKDEIYVRDPYGNAFALSRASD